MQLATLQGTPLILHLTAKDRVYGGHPHPIVEFRYTGGILCASYYLRDFSDIKSGLCLVGGTINREDLSADTVALCQQYCAQQTGIPMQSRT